MSLIRFEPKWNPWKEMEDLQSRLSQALGAGPSNTRVANQEKEGLATPEWAPLVDILEDDGGYYIKAELADVSKEDLKVKVQDGVLTVSGERKFEKAENSKRYHRVERVYGNFSRGFTLPDDADPSKVTAEFKAGVLHVHVGKSEKAAPKQIEVKVN